MSGPLDLARAQDGYGRGATLVLNRLEKFWAPCTALAKEVEAALQVYTSLNMYFTPPKSRGFDPHFDYEDVFIVQVQGVKRWRVWGPDPVRIQALQTQLDPREGSETLLVIPGGWAGAAAAERESHDADEVRGAHYRTTVCHPQPRCGTLFYSGSC